MVSYLIEAEQVDILDNQLATQQCYQATIEVKQIDLIIDEPKSSSAKSQ